MYLTFSNRGNKVLIYELDRGSVRAALQLSGQKWGTFRVHGSQEYKRLCVELAAEQGFKITNPELQQTIATERARRQQARPLAGPTRSDAERVDRGHPNVSRPIDPPRRSAAPAQPRQRVRDVAEAYERHFENVWKARGRADVSRVDALIAVRLRATGYPKWEVGDAIRKGAARMRPDERRDWAEYAKRATEHAFGISGERDFSRAERVRNRLLTMEGRMSPSRDEPELEMPRGGPLDRLLGPWR